MEAFPPVDIATRTPGFCSPRQLLLEKIDPDKEAIFIIQDSKQMSLIHYKKDCEGASFKMM